MHYYHLIPETPGAPSKPRITQVDSTRMTLAWSPPDSDGRSPITNYVLERKDKFSTRWMRVTRDRISETEFTVVDLIEGTEYEFRVSAENKAGVGPPSDVSESRVAKSPYGELISMYIWFAPCVYLLAGWNMLS